MGFELNKKYKTGGFSIKDTELLSASVIAKLAKANIKTPEQLYWSIQKEPQKISEMLGVSIGDTYALGTFLLDWIDKESLKYWAGLSLKKTGSPLKLDYQQKYDISIRDNNA